MTAPEPIAHARLNAEGHVVAIDGRLSTLNSEAGGGEGLPLALPALAAVATLSMRLGIPVARSVRVADGPEDLMVRASARPIAAGVELKVSGWRRCQVVPLAAGCRDELSFDAADADFIWETDASMVLTAMSGDAALIGQPISRAFDFNGGDGLVGILAATANYDCFVDQPAHLLPSARPVLLSGDTRKDAAGDFAGISGAGRFVEQPEGAEPPPSGFGARFTARLDRALRAPLQRIVASADSISALADGPLRREYFDYAQDIASAARHLMGLVDDLVDLSAVERPDFRVAADQIDLADIARRAAALLGVRAVASEVRIDRPADDVTLFATGEARRVLQILVNLIGNAVRYSPPGGTVTVVAVRHADSASVIVADDGRGIAHEHHARIFEKFGRVDPTEPGGNGLGLYIAQRLARAMGGGITVESAAGQGARFTLTLPKQ